jgi:hypothetical protein
MTELRLGWNLSGRGWADCTVADHEAETVITASYITMAPEELIAAVTRLLAGEGEARAQFEAEPTAFRWIFYREGEAVWIRLLQVPDADRHDRAGTEIWTSWQTVDNVARAVIRCFDNVARTYGESGYHGKWCHPFPRAELEALRTNWRSGRTADPA